MPILQVSLTRDALQRQTSASNPSLRLARLAQIEEKTVTVHTHEMQACFGNRYQGIAHLYLPDLWPGPKIASIQQAAARLIAEIWEIATDEIIVMAHPIASGRVCDKGVIETW